MSGGADGADGSDTVLLASILRRSSSALTPLEPLTRLSGFTYGAASAYPSLQHAAVLEPQVRMLECCTVRLDGNGIGLSRTRVVMAGRSKPGRR
jgi:hypothetical protein